MLHRFLLVVCCSLSACKDKNEVSHPSEEVPLFSISLNSPLPSYRSQENRDLHRCQIQSLNGLFLKKIKDFLLPILLILPCLQHRREHLIPWELSGLKVLMH